MLRRNIKIPDLVVSLVLTTWVIFILLAFLEGYHQLQDENAKLREELAESQDLLEYFGLQVSRLEDELEWTYTDLYLKWEEFIDSDPGWTIKEFELTGYAPFDNPVGICSDGNPASTSTGTYPTEGRTIAVDPEVIPYGTPVWIDGFGWRIAEDTGGAIRGRKIDIMFERREDAMFRYDAIVVYPNIEE